MVTGIVPKMAIRFTSYEWYKQMLANKSTGAVSGQATFFGELPPPPSPNPEDYTHPHTQPDSRLV